MARDPGAQACTWANELKSTKILGQPGRRKAVRKAWIKAQLHRATRRLGKQDATGPSA